MPWTYITGSITVDPMGRTQAEKRYILDTVLDHLPRVTGGEDDMHIHVVHRRCGPHGSSSHNEFQEWIPWKQNRVDNEYILVLEASLRHRHFEDTLREFNKWLNRLAKRVCVTEILVKLDGYSNSDFSGKQLIIANAEPYRQMEEWASWCTEKSGGEPAWAEYLMWDRAKDSGYPAVLAYKYFSDMPENDAEVERRLKYGKE